MAANKDKRRSLQKRKQACLTLLYTAALAADEVLKLIEALVKALH